MDILLKNGYDIAQLVSCVLHNKQLNKEDIASMNLSLIYQLSCKHSISALVGTALKTCCGVKLSAEWEEAVALAIVRHVQFECERKAIEDFMKENNIWHMPMKGLIVGALYPDAVYREMCDNDILYDPAGSKKLVKFMIEQGYEIDYMSKDKHADGFTKPPYFSFELHKRFFMANHELWAEYYSDMNKFLIPDKDNPLQYHLSDEDFYVYMMLHTYKHYSQSGTGIRSLIDCYVYNLKKGEHLNWSYITEELRKLQIDKFEQDFRTIGKKLFGIVQCALTEEEERIFKYVLSSGTYGTHEHAVENKMKQLTGDVSNKKSKKYRYYWKRLFPDLLWFKGNMPFCYRHRWAIPFYYIYRIVCRGTRHRKQIYSEVKTVKELE